MFSSLPLPVIILFSMVTYYLLFMVIHQYFIKTFVPGGKSKIDQMHARYSHMMYGKGFWYRHIGWLFDKNRQSGNIITLRREDYRFIDDGELSPHFQELTGDV